MKVFVLLLLVTLACTLCAEDGNAAVDKAVKQAVERAIQLGVEVPVRVNVRRNPAETNALISPSSTLAISFAPTRLRWPGGKKTLQETVEWLSTQGNDTTLDPSLLEARTLSLELPFLEGTYWEAIQAVCQTYRLGIRAPKRYARSYYGNASRGQYQILQTEGGPVVLALRPGASLPGQSTSSTPSASKAVDIKELRNNPTALRAFLSKQMSASRTERQNDSQTFADALNIPAGLAMVLVEDAGIFSATGMERGTAIGRVDYRLRLEPRISLQTLGPGLMCWNQIQTSAGRSLPFSNEENGYQARNLDDILNNYGYSGNLADNGRIEPSQLLLQGVSKLDRGFSLAGTFDFAQLESLERAWLMKPGDERALEGGGKKLSISFIDAGEGKTLENTSSRWGLKAKFNRNDGWIGRPNITLRDSKGEPIRNHGQSTNSDGTSYTIHMGLQNGNAVQATIKCNRVIGRQSLPISFTLLIP